MSDHKDNSDAMDRYTRQLRTLRSGHTCPSAEKLWAYVSNETTDVEKRTLNEHLDLCPACLDLVQKLQTHLEQEIDATQPVKNWARLEKKMDEHVYAFLETLNPQKSSPHPVSDDLDLWSRITRTIVRLFAPPKLAYAGLAVALLLTSLYGYAFMSRSETFALAHLDHEQPTSLRGAPARDDLFYRGLEQLENGKLESAIRDFTIYRKEHGEHYGVHFYLGLTHLAKAERGLPGLAYDFDAAEVNTGIRSLRAALELAGDNAFYIEDCLWYLGKASLMLEDIGSARRYFDRLLALQYPGLMRQEQTRDVLARLAQLEKK